MTPRVTVVMPVYNGGRYLSRAIASVLAQEYSNFEIVIVNDGSTDEHTARIAQAFHEANPDRIKYIQQENGGVAVALNTALEVATGDFFCWLSHDDLYYSDRLKSQVEYYEQFGLADACIFSNFSLIDAESKKISGPFLGADIFLSIPELSLLHSGINGCGLLVPMAIMKRYGQFDTSLRYTQDFDFWGRILQNHPFVYQNTELVLYRIHAQQGSQHPAAADEGGTLWINLLEQQDEITRVQMFGSKKRFYAGIGEFLRNSSYTQAIAYTEAMVRRANSGLLVTVLLLVEHDETATWQSINSIIAQSHQNWELLLLTTHRTSFTDRINSKILDKSRIHWVTAEIHEAELLNRGLDLARGEYIAFIKSGDILLPNRFSSQLDAMVSEGRLVSHGSHFAWWKAMSTRRIIIAQDKESVTVNSHSMSPVNISFSTLMVHRIINASGLRFEAGSPYYIYLFIADLATSYNWIGVNELIAEIIVDRSSPLIDLDRRSKIEAACRQHIPASDRLFCSLDLTSNAVNAAAARMAFVNSFDDSISAPWFTAPVATEHVSTDSQKLESLAKILFLLAPAGCVLLVTHDLGGGIGRFLQERNRSLHRDGYAVLVLRCTLETGGILLEHVDIEGNVLRSMPINIGDSGITKELEILRICKVEVHTLVEFKPSLWEPMVRSLLDAKVPYVVYLHDYAFVCPLTSFVRPDGMYCGEPDIHACERCIAEYGRPYGNPTVSLWRTVHGRMLRNAEHVIALDEDVKNRFQSYFPRLIVDVHPVENFRRILVLGHCGTHKGSDTLVRTARAALEQNRPIEFVLLGTSNRDDDLRDLSNVRLLGAYHDSSLRNRIVEISPDLIWFPGMAVETFSYTLSAAFESGVFPVAFDIGAIASRIRASGRGWLLPLWMALDPDTIVKQLLSVVSSEHLNLTDSPRKEEVI